MRVHYRAEVGSSGANSGLRVQQEWAVGSSFKEETDYCRGKGKDGMFKCVFFKLWSPLVLHCSHIRCLSQNHCPRPGPLPLTHTNIQTVTFALTQQYSLIILCLCGQRRALFWLFELLLESTPKQPDFYIHCSNFQLLYLLYCTIVNKLQHINTVTTKLSELLLFYKAGNFVFFLPIRWTFFYLFTLSFFTAFY